MKIEEILPYVDHTLLSQTAVWEEIKRTCQEAIACKTASVCIPPSFVQRAAELIQGRIPVCTVIGFPNGYHTRAAKEFETEEAIRNGASELDMVINLGWVKEERYDLVLDEIKALKAICGKRVLKVIVETCLLEDMEKLRLCEIVTESGADYIKTSTGFAGGGALGSDIRLFAKYIGPHVKIKASGGIATQADAEQFLSLGASRLGTSRLVKLAVQN